MKKTFRIICLAMALVMLCLCAASCGGGEVSATISIKFIGADGEVLLEHPNFSVLGTTKEPPTALMAAEQVLQNFEIVYELTDDGNSIAAAFGLKQEDSHDENKGYFKYWKCTVNGQNSESGRQSTTYIYGGDAIEFVWTEGEKDREDTVAVETTNPADYETEFIEQETEPETEEVAE